MLLDLVVPLYNEAPNINKLVEGLLSSELPRLGLRRLVLVDNGSSDDSWQKLQWWQSQSDLVHPAQLNLNDNYGGGLQEGFRHCKSEFVGYLPGDNQVQSSDVVGVWQQLCRRIGEGQDSKCLLKGMRVVRKDPLGTRVSSRIYTFAANAMLGLRVRDVNGLPKIFHRSLLEYLPSHPQKNFTFDAQLLSVARKLRWPIEEVPVTFHDRRMGVSSWSSKRMRTYVDCARELWKLRGLSKSPSHK